MDRNLSASEKWLKAKEEWNAAFVAACATAEHVVDQVRRECGQRVYADQLLARLRYNAEKIHREFQGDGFVFKQGGFIAACWHYWGKPLPVEQHWHGTLAQVRASTEALRQATPERLHQEAAEMLLAE